MPIKHFYSHSGRVLDESKNYNLINIKQLKQNMFILNIIQTRIYTILLKSLFGKSTFHKYDQKLSKEQMNPPIE